MQGLPMNTNNQQWDMLQTFETHAVAMSKHQQMNSRILCPNKWLIAYRSLAIAKNAGVFIAVSQQTLSFLLDWG
jgi:hypothetical protein